MYYMHQFFQTIFNRLENDEDKVCFQVWKQFSVLDCIRTVSLDCGEIKPSTLNACWRILLPQMVQKGNEISAPLTNIVKISSALRRDEFVDINHEDTELPMEESLNDDELGELIDESSYFKYIMVENTDYESVSDFRYDVKNGRI
ncbi:tigger transposable element-derived protein 1 [Nephila pilipes]|uniref:Tigger transposable element-derived protein 1 n=1 Tax=Nephila pilipes TaxID=299642 RepID=A0A8X6I697_NEPPI|nr:tigger transposable element-derived protein 1 [Nephila pilipes]